MSNQVTYIFYIEFNRSLHGCHSTYMYHPLQDDYSHPAKFHRIPKPQESGQLHNYVNNFFQEGSLVTYVGDNHQHSNTYLNAGM